MFTSISDSVENWRSSPSKFEIKYSLVLYWQTVERGLMSGTRVYCVFEISNQILQTEISRVRVKPTERHLQMCLRRAHSVSFPKSAFKMSITRSARRLLREVHLGNSWRPITVVLIVKPEQKCEPLRSPSREKIILNSKEFSYLTARRDRKRYFRQFNRPKRSALVKQFAIDVERQNFSRRGVHS